MSAYKPITCVDCGGDMTWREISPTFQFPTRKAVYAYRCTNPGCTGRVAATKAGKVKGVQATAAVRQARADCESVFDPLWRDAVNLYDIEETDREARDAIVLRIKTTAKSRTYRFIAHQLGIEPKAARIENIADLHTLKKFWHAANNASAEQIRDWAKAQREGAGQ